MLAFKVFRMDILRIVNVLFVGFSNGFFCTLLVIYGPAKCAPHEKAKAGQLMGMSIVSGIFLGTLIAFAGVSRISFPE